MWQVAEHFVPREHQRLGTQFLLGGPRRMLVADPGLGKTTEAYSAVDILSMAGGDCLPVLVLAPKRVADVVWTGERDKWDAFQDFKVIKIMGTPAERLAALHAPKADIYVCNYDLVPWLVAQLPPGKWPFKLVIADECSKLKGFRLNKGGVRAGELAKIARFTPLWWNLTGTPCPNGLQDLWGQMWFIDQGERLGRTYTHFFDRFFIQNEYTRKITMQQGAEKEIHDAVKDVLAVFRVEDWLDVMQPEVIPIQFKLPPKAQEQYDAMEKDYFLSLTDKDIEVGTAAAKGFKLLQMCSGNIYDDTGTTHHIHDAKIEALADVVEQTGPEPIIVTYWWQFDRSVLQNAFPGARVYSGQKDQDDFNAGKIKMLLLHEQSAYGISLHHGGRDIVFYSYVWNAELRQQMVERCGPARQAQAGYKRVVRIWDISAVGTVEEDVIASNAGKITVEQALKQARARVRSKR
jgi:SNF2 family DNA or RNA helicase